MAEKTTKKKKKTKEKICLVLPPLMAERLKQEKDRSAYDSVQEVIKETIRKRYFLKDEEPAKKLYAGAKRGPKPKIEHEKMVTGKNILVR